MFIATQAIKCIPTISINKALITGLILLVTQFYAANVFAASYGWDTATQSGAGDATTVTETVSGVTATVTGDKGIQVDPFVAPVAGVTDDGLLAVNFPAINYTFSFSHAVDITSIFTGNGSGGSDSFTFTPTGGSNSVVNETITGFGLDVALNWTGVTSFTVTATGATSVDALVFDAIVFTPTPDTDGSLTVAAGVTEPVGLDTTVDLVGEAVDVFDFTLSDGGGGDGFAMAVSEVVVNVLGTSTDAQRSNVTWRLNGSDVSNVVGTYDSGNDTITFSPISISVADGASEVYTVNAFYNDNTGVTEDATFILSVDGDTDLTISGTSTQMGSTTPVNNGAGGTFDVVATALAFTTQPADSVSGSTLTTQPVVTAQDAFGNTDVDFSETVTVTEASAGSITNNTATAVSGVATFSGLTYSATVDQESFTLTANDQDGVGSDLLTVDSNAVISSINSLGSVSISGNAVVGQTLSATVTDSDGTPTPISFQWMSASTVVSSTANYTIAASDVGNTITVNAVYTDGLIVAENVTSTPTTAVVTVEEDALDTISAIAGNGSSSTPTANDYTNAGVTGVNTPQVLVLINNAVRLNTNSTDVDSASKLQTLVNAILEGQDNDVDGLPNAFEGLAAVDTDGDGTADRDDNDSDNDGIGDRAEIGLDLTDTDMDGIIDVFDADVGNVGAIDAGKVDANFDGVNDNLDTVAEVLATFLIMDTDNDTQMNHLDLDADNDSLLDVNEAGFTDSNGDGFVDAGQVVITAQSGLTDSDSDTIPDFLELMSDGVTNDMLMSTFVIATIDANADGRIDDPTDDDKDGIANIIDNLAGFGLSPVVPVTPSSGGGGSSTSPLVLLLLFTLLCLRVGYQRVNR